METSEAEKEGVEAASSFWRPVETAPKDGTIIDVWVTHPDVVAGYRVTNVRWKDGDWWSPEAPVEALFTGLVPLIRVSHWMPLPPPPNRKDEDR